MFVTRYKMGSIFAEIKDAAKLDYAFTNGVCCNTCTNEELSDDFGENSKGIWLKWFKTGGNKSTWSSHKSFNISHDVADEQLNIILEILKKYFEVVFDGDTSRYIEIKAKVA